MPIFSILTFLKDHFIIAEVLDYVNNNISRSCRAQVFILKNIFYIKSFFLY